MRFFSRASFLLIIVGWALVIMVWGYSYMRGIKSPVATIPLGATSHEQTSATSDLKTSTSVFFGSSQIRVAIADTEPLRAKGLSGVSRIDDDEGMLFVFDQPARHSFWMPNMNFPIDIIWMDAHKKIIDVTKNAEQLKSGERPMYYQPQKPAQYVLEVGAGFFDAHELKIGMTMMGY